MANQNIPQLACLEFCPGFSGNIVIFMASQDEVIDSLVSVVRTAVQRNAAPQTTMQTADDADDFSAVLSATRAAMRRRRRNVRGKHP